MAAGEVPLYDALGANYDRLISWDERLGREGPFFREQFQAHRVKAVLDVATGTAMHARLFADWGLEVMAADPSPEMLKAAEANCEGKNVVLVQASFAELEEKVGGSFDAITCLGNSLPHVSDERELRQSLANMAACLRPSGILIIHNNNYDRILERREQFMPLASSLEAEKELLFLRFFDFHDDTLTFNVVTMLKDGGQWSFEHSSATHLALRKDLLEAALRGSGFRHLAWYGSYQKEPFDRLASDNLIVVAARATPTTSAL